MINGLRIKRTRERLGENQAEFAKRFGVDQSTIHRWERYGGPDRGPAALAVEQIIRELEREAIPAKPRPDPALLSGADR